MTFFQVFLLFYIAGARSAIGVSGLIVLFIGCMTYNAHLFVGGRMFNRSISLISAGHLKKGALITMSKAVHYNIPTIQNSPFKVEQFAT